MKLSWEKIEDLRDVRYRRTKTQQVTDAEGALQFINDTGFCFAFAAKNSELPCLWHAVCGERAPRLPEHIQHDWSIGLVWRFKDILPAQKKIYYGKALKRRPTMISLDYFPYFYRVKREKSGAASYLAQYMRGFLSPAAKKIMDSLSEMAPQVTRELKQASGFSDPKKRYEFDRAMAELQMEMYVVKIGEFYDPFMFLWDLVVRRFEGSIKKAESLSLERARRHILEKYFENVLVSRSINIQRLFGWETPDINAALDVLCDRGTIREVVINGEIHPYLGHTSLLS